MFIKFFDCTLACRVFWIKFYIALERILRISVNFKAEKVQANLFTTSAWRSSQSNQFVERIYKQRNWIKNVFKSLRALRVWRSPAVNLLNQMATRCARIQFYWAFFPSVSSLGARKKMINVSNKLPDNHFLWPILLFSLLSLHRKINAKNWINKFDFNIFRGRFLFLNSDCLLLRAYKLCFRIAHWRKFVADCCEIERNPLRRLLSVTRSQKEASKKIPFIESSNSQFFIDTLIKIFYAGSAHSCVSHCIAKWLGFIEIYCSYLCIKWYLYLIYSHSIFLFLPQQSFVIHSCVGSVVRI